MIGIWPEALSLIIVALNDLAIVDDAKHIGSNDLEAVPGLWRH